MARNLTAQPRTMVGKNNNNRLRVQGFIPGVLYSHGSSESIQISKKDFKNVFATQISESVIIDMDINGKEKCHVFVKDYQRDPVSEEIVHLDFYKITEGEKIKTAVPLETQGTSIGARLGGVFEMIDRFINVECLPSELPEKIVIDITDLNIGMGIQVKDIKGPASMKILLDPEHIVAHVTTVKEEAAPVAETAEEAAPVTSSSAPEEKKEKDKE
jgi:large subunit ribosomal protein L25